MTLPYPLERGDVSLEKYLLHLVTALVQQAGGEVRLTSCAILEASTCSLSKSVTREKDGIVLRTSPEGAELYFAAREAESSLTSSRPRTASTTSTSTEPRLPEESARPRSKQLTDLDAYLLEAEQAARQAERMESPQAQPGVYPWTTRSGLPRQ